MQLNEAKFRVNGNCGYVLKPQQMCKGNVPLYVCYCKCQGFQKVSSCEAVKTQGRKVRAYTESFVSPYVHNS